MKYILGIFTCLFVVVAGFINGSSSKVEESKQCTLEYRQKLIEHTQLSDSLRININKLEQIKQLYKK